MKQVPATSKTQSSPANKYRVTSLDKALLILELVIDQGRDLSITGICQKLGMAKGTVHRVINTLVARKFLRMAMAPFLMDLYETCGETINVAVWEYNEIRYIYRLESEEMLRISIKAGVRFPGYCAATGKVLLSYLSNDDIRRIYGWENSLKKYTPNTISSLDELIDEIEKVRIGKVAIDDEESLPGVYCVGAPILSSKGECVAAISISAPKNRVDKKKSVTFVRLVSETARKISDSLCEP